MFQAFKEDIIIRYLVIICVVCFGVLFSAYSLHAFDVDNVLREKAWLSYLMFTKMDQEKTYELFLKERLSRVDLGLLVDIAKKESLFVKKMISSYKRQFSAFKNRIGYIPNRLVRDFNLEAGSKLKTLHSSIPIRLKGTLKEAIVLARNDREKMRDDPGLNQGLVFRVYATQYEGNTDKEAALPDKLIKFTNRGWQETEGYDNPMYVARVSLPPSQMFTFIVWDVGPWNEDDNYWKDKKDRRIFKDLPKGLPEAEAAFFDNYNGGRDQFGRKVLNPAGIDLTPKAAADLGLEYLENAWINIYYGNLP